MSKGFNVGDWVKLDHTHKDNVEGDEIFDLVLDRVRKVSGNFIEFKENYRNLI